MIDIACGFAYAIAAFGFAYGFASSVSSDKAHIRIKQLEAQLAAVRELPDRWNGEDGEYLGADDCAYELQQAIGEDNE